MNLLEESRLEINEVDAELIKLFERRMHAVEGVIKYKKEHNLPIFDSSREAANIEKGCSLLQDASLKKYFKEWYHSTMDISKEYQRDILASSNK